MRINHPFWNDACQLISKGRFKQAQPLIKTLLGKYPELVEVRYAHALILQELGEYNKAVSTYGTFMDDAASHPSWHINYGVCLLRSGQAHLAEYQFALALRKDPKFPDKWLINYSLALSQNGKPEDAQSALRILLQRSPNSVTGVQHLASLFTQRDMHKESINAWRRYIELAPKEAIGYVNLAAALFHTLAYAESEAVCRAGIAITGESARILSNLACAVLGQNRLDEAREIFDHALRLEPDNVETAGAAIGLMHLAGMHDQAAELLERGIDRPDTGHEYRYLLSTARLYQQRFDKGWALTRDRWRSKHFAKPHAHYDFPEWRGESLDGKGILVMCEQGLADQLQALTLLPDLLALGPKVAVELDIRLLPMAQRSMPEVLFYPFATPPLQPTNIDFNYYVAMGDLGSFFRRSLKDFERQPRAYLRPDPGEVDKWRERLPQLPTYGLA